MTPDQFGDARRSLGWSQTELARRLDAARETINRWEHGTLQVPELVAMWLRERVRFDSVAMPPPQHWKRPHYEE